MALALAFTSESSALELANEIPKTAFTKPTHAKPEIRPQHVISDNVRAIAVMHAVARYEKAGLFAAGDRIVLDAKHKKLHGAAAKAVAKLASQYGTAKGRHGELGFVADLIREQFQALIDQSITQMDAYEALLSSVASSVDAFTEDGVSSNEERDSLVKQGLAVSHAGYAAVHHVAAKLGGVAHELTHVVQQPSVQKAYGAKDAADLVAKLSGKTKASVAKELAIAEQATKLLLWLRHTDQPAKLAARAKSDDLAAIVAKLKKLAALQSIPIVPGAKLPKPRPLCLPPGSSKPTRCAVMVAKP